MRIILLGTGTAVPFNGRAQTGILIETGDGICLIDCGSGVINNLSSVQYNPADIEAVLITHMHPDHVNDTISLLAARALSGVFQTTIYGPEGIDNCINSLVNAYSGLQTHTHQNITALRAQEEIKLSGISIRTFPTHHGQQNSIGYKIQYGNKVVVIPGDTAVSGQDLSIADGADLLIHECSYPDGIETPDHTTPSALAEAISGRSIDKLVLVHLYQEAYIVRDAILKTVSQRFAGEIIIGNDLDAFEI